jgi:hypothetical protein
MNSQKSNLSAALLATLPSAADLAEQRLQACAAIAAERRKMKIQRTVVHGFWILCVALSILYFWFDPTVTPAIRAPFLAGFFLFWGAFEVVKHRIEAAKLDTLREIKLLQLQVLEAASAREGKSSTSNL